MKRLTTLTLLAALACPTAAFAAEDADPNTGALTLTGGVDWTCAYFFRGYNQEDSGLILQPKATLGFGLVDSDGLDVNGYVGVWSSVHGEKTASNGSNGAWYEADLYAGVDFVLGGGFTVGAIYTLYTYPNGAFDSIQEFGVKVSYDDTDFMKDKTGFALKPYLGVYFETDDGNGSDDIYAEIGIAPTVYTLNDKSDMPVSFSVPIILGLSLDDFYTDSDGDNEVFGYVSVGVSATIPLPIPSRYGAWSMTGNVSYLFLMADSVEAANSGDEHQVIGTLGVGFSY